MKREGGKSQELLMQSEEETAKELVSSERMFKLDQLSRGVLGASF